MTAVTLTPLAKQLYSVQPQNSHPTVSLRRVLWVRFIRWIDKASFHAIAKTFWRVTTVVLLSFAVMIPQYTAGLLTSAAAWNGYRIPIFLALLTATLNAKRVYLFIRRKLVRRRGGNQHTYHGIPVGELASYLMEQRSFKRDEAMDKFALSQGQYVRITSELKKHGILVHGENNAHVLREISMENLVRQLRDDFPLVWSEERQEWAERNGVFERWAMSQDFQQRKLSEETARKERKIERLNRKIQETSKLASVFQYSA